MAVGSIVARILTQYSDKGSKAASKDIMKLGKSFDQFAKKSARAFGLAAVASAAFAIKIGKDSIMAAITAQAEQSRLNQILMTTGAATAEQIKALNAQAEALEAVGVVSAGNVKVTQSQLATFDLQATTIKTLTPAILDYVTAEKGATASADQFKSMTNGLAQALNGQFGALTRAGFVLDEQTKKLISNGTEGERAEAIVRVLNSTYKGFNERLRDTPEGQLQVLRNSFDAIKTTLGNALLPVMERFVQLITTKILPQLEMFVAINKDQLAASFAVAAEFAFKFLEVAIAFGNWVANNTTTVKILAGIIAGMFVVSGIAKFILAVQGVIAVMRVLTATSTAAAIATALATGGSNLIIGGAVIAATTGLVIAKNMGGGGSNTSQTTERARMGGYPSSALGGSFPVKPNPVISGPGSDLNNILKSLGKTMTTTAKASKALLTQKQKELNLKLKELGIVTTEQQDAITQMAILKNAERQKRIAKSATIGIGSSGALGSQQGGSVVVNVAGSVSTENDLVTVVNDGLNRLYRRSLGIGGGSRFEMQIK
jgi:hypothetical protein